MKLPTTLLLFFTTVVVLIVAISPPPIGERELLSAFIYFFILLLAFFSCGFTITTLGKKIAAKKGQAAEAFVSCSAFIGFPIILLLIGVLRVVLYNAPVETIIPLLVVMFATFPIIVVMYLNAKKILPEDRRRLLFISLLVFLAILLFPIAMIVSSILNPYGSRDLSSLIGMLIGITSANWVGYLLTRKLEKFL